MCSCDAVVRGIPAPGAPSVESQNLDTRSLHYSELLLPKLNWALLCAAAMLLCAANLLEHASLGLYGRQIRESVYRVLAEGKVTDFPIYTFKGLKRTLSRERLGIYKYSM